MKMKVNKKKIIVLVAMVVLLVATGVLNWALNSNYILGNNQNTSGNATVETFFSAYRTDRTATREEEFLYLDAILSSENSSEAAKTEAESQKMKLISRMEEELNIEALIKSKGFEDVVVTMTSGNVNVIVSSAELSEEQAAQILDIIVTQTSYGATSVNITPYN